MQNNECFKVTSSLIYPETVEKGKQIKVLDTHVNLKWLLEHFKAEIRYNLMTRRREINFSTYTIFPDDVENDALFQVNYIATINGMPTKQLDIHLDKLAFNNSYHPIAESIALKPWDGIYRLDNFINTIDAKEPELAKKIIKTWMVCAIAAAHSHDGFINNGVLVLQGAQNIGKTRWVKSLDPIDCDAIREGAFLDPTNKDSVIQLSRYWISELGELDSIFKKSEIGRLKSFITMESDDVRLPYARRSTRLARRSAYVATVNDSNFLIDDTGNRRWWTIIVKEIDLDHGLDMQQVWAETYATWKAGALTYLDSDIQSFVNESNKNHERTDPLREKLLTWYDWSNPARKWLTATAVLEEMGYTKPNRADATAMGKILTEKNGVEGKKINGIKVHEVPVYIKYRNNTNDQEYPLRY
jgi:putative DNA primase/helicase